MLYDELDQQVRAGLAMITETDAEDWFLVFKARYGMEVVFRSIAKIHGVGEVLTSYHTCPVAIGPIVVAGMTPVYQPTSRANLFMDDAPVGDRTRAVIRQHTFGLVQAMERISGALLIEDSAPCLGTLVRDGAGVVADVSIHSFGVEKLLRTTIFGGAVYVNPQMSDLAVRDELRRALSQLPTVRGRIDFIARIYRQQLRGFRLLPQGLARRVRLMMTKAKVFEPAVSPIEQAAGLPYEPMKPSKWMLVKMLAGLKTVPEEHARRQQVSKCYLDGLGDLGDQILIPDLVRTSLSSLTTFPVFLATTELAHQARDLLATAGIYTGRWYAEDTLFSVACPEKFGISESDPGLQPSRDFIDKLVCLPTNLSVEQARGVVEIVQGVVTPPQCGQVTPPGATA